MNKNPNLIVLTFTPVNHIRNMTLPSLCSVAYAVNAVSIPRCPYVCEDECKRLCALIPENSAISCLLKHIKL